MAKKRAETPESTLSVGELSKRSGVAISAIHFYESKGLIPSWRNSGNQRRFPRGVLRIISLIKVAQYLGLSLDEIKDSFKQLPNNRAPTFDDWKKLSVKWEKELNKKINNLILLKDQLNKCIGCGCLSIEDCPLRNPDDKLASKGPGAHFINKCLDE